jgi:Protein of unknown function (DUF3047)
MTAGRALLSFLAALFVLTAPAHLAGTVPIPDTVFKFTGYSGGPVLKWLEQKGFVAKRDATSASKVQFSIAGGDLILEAKRKALALLLSEANLAGFSRVRITWGVDEFPEGASYEKGVRSDAAMVYIFFGDEKLSSGSMLVPDSPYFIGLFLCQTDPVGRAYQGRYFKAGGRYVCVDQTKTGQTVTTNFAIDDAFKRFFGLSRTPYISGLGIAIDTDSAKGKGTAKSFIREIEFLR